MHKNNIPFHYFKQKIVRDEIAHRKWAIHCNVLSPSGMINSSVSSLLSSKVPRRLDHLDGLNSLNIKDRSGLCPVLDLQSKTHRRFKLLLPGAMMSFRSNPDRAEGAEARRGLWKLERKLVIKPEGSRSSRQSPLQTCRYRTEGCRATFGLNGQSPSRREQEQKPNNFLNGQILNFGHFPICVTKKTTFVTNLKYNENMNTQLTDFLKTYKLAKLTKSYKDFNNISIEAKKIKIIQRPINQVNSTTSYGTIDINNNFKITYHTLKGLMKYRKVRRLYPSSSAISTLEDSSKILDTYTYGVSGMNYPPSGPSEGDIKNISQPKSQQKFQTKQQNRSYGFLQSILVKYLETTREVDYTLGAVEDRRSSTVQGLYTLGVGPEGQDIKDYNGQVSTVSWPIVKDFAPRPSTMTWSSKNRNKQHFLFTKISNKTFLAYWLIPVAGFALLTPKIYGCANTIHYNLNASTVAPHLDVDTSNFNLSVLSNDRFNFKGRRLLPKGAVAEQSSIMDNDIIQRKQDREYLVETSPKNIKAPFGLTDFVRYNDALIPYDAQLDQGIYSPYSYIKPLNNLYALINAQTFFSKKMFTKSSTNTNSILQRGKSIMMGKPIRDVKQKQFNSQLKQVSHNWSEPPIWDINTFYKSNMDLSVLHKNKSNGLYTLGVCSEDRRLLCSLREQSKVLRPIEDCSRREQLFPSGAGLSFSDNRQYLLIKNYLNLKQSTPFSIKNNKRITRLKGDTASRYLSKGQSPLVPDGQGFSEAPLDYIRRYSRTTEFVDNICKQSINPLYSTTLLNNNLNFITTKNSLKLLDFKILTLNTFWAVKEAAAPDPKGSNTLGPLRGGRPECINHTQNGNSNKISASWTAQKLKTSYGAECLSTQYTGTKRFLLSKSNMATQPKSELFKPFRSYNQALNLVNLNIKSNITNVLVNCLTPLDNNFTTLSELLLPCLRSPICRLDIGNLKILDPKGINRPSLVSYNILFKLWSEPNTSRLLTEPSQAQISYNGRVLNHRQPTTNVQIFYSNKNNLLLNYFLYTYGVTNIDLSVRIKNRAKRMFVTDYVPYPGGPLRGWAMPIAPGGPNSVLLLPVPKVATEGPEVAPGGSSSRSRSSIISMPKAVRGGYAPPYGPKDILQGKQDQEACSTYGLKAESSRPNTSENLLQSKTVGTKYQNQEFLSNGPLNLKINLIKTTTPRWKNLCKAHSYSTLPILAHAQLILPASAIRFVPDDVRNHNHQSALTAKHKANGLNLYLNFINKKLKSFIFLNNINYFNTSLSNVRRKFAYKNNNSQTDQNGQSYKQFLYNTCQSKGLRRNYMYASTSILLKHQKMFKNQSALLPKDRRLLPKVAGAPQRGPEGDHPVGPNSVLLLQVPKVAPSGSSSRSNLRSQEVSVRLHIQKKRKAKKQRLETRRQKKRMRFFPRPVWLRYRMFLNFVNQRNLKNNQPLTFTQSKSFCSRREQLLPSGATCGPSVPTDAPNLVQWPTRNNYLDPVRTYKSKQKLTSNAIKSFTIKSSTPFGSNCSLREQPAVLAVAVPNSVGRSTLLCSLREQSNLRSQTPFTFRYLILRCNGFERKLVISRQNPLQTSSIVNIVKANRRLVWDGLHLPFGLTDKVSYEPAESSQKLPSTLFSDKIQSFQTKKFLRDIKIKANYVNFKNQKTNNPPPLPDKDKDTIFRDIWIWTYNNISPNKSNQNLWWLLPNNMSTLTFSKKEGDSYSKVFQTSANHSLWAFAHRSFGWMHTQTLWSDNMKFAGPNSVLLLPVLKVALLPPGAEQGTSSHRRLLSKGAVAPATFESNLRSFGSSMHLSGLRTDRAKTESSRKTTSLQISKHLFARTLTRIHWALNKTNYSSFIDYNKRYNLWGTQKLRNQSKNNKTKYLEKQFITNWEKFFLNKKLHAFYKKISSKLNQKTQKLNYLTNYTRSQDFLTDSSESLFSGPASGGTPRVDISLGNKVRYDRASKSRFFYEPSKNQKNFNTAWWSDLNIKSLLTDLTINKTINMGISEIDLSVLRHSRSLDDLHGLIHSNVSPLWIASVEGPEVAPGGSSSSSRQSPLQTTSTLLISCSVLLHFCALISLLSISQVRCFVKFHIILLYKLSNIYNTLLRKISRASLDKGTRLQREKSKVNDLRLLPWATDTRLPADTVDKNHSVFGLSTLGVPPFGGPEDQTQKKLLTYFCFNLLKKEFNSSNLDSKIRPKDRRLLPKGADHPEESRKSRLLQFNKKSWARSAHLPLSHNLRSKLNIISLKAAFLKGGTLKSILSPKQLTAVREASLFAAVPKISDFRQGRGPLKLREGGKAFFESKNSLEFYYKSSRTKLNIKKTRNFLLKFSKNLIFKVVFNFIDLFQSSVRNISNFFEKPAEFTTTWIAYGFLVEWSSDLITIIPENIDIYIWNVFSKLTRITPISSMPGAYNLICKVVFNNSIFIPALLTVSYLVHRRIFYLFDTFFETISQPDTDLLRRQQKGTLFWDLWADFIVTAADYYNVNVAALSTIKAEQNILIEKISNDANDFGHMSLTVTNPSGLGILLPSGATFGRPFMSHDVYTLGVGPENASLKDKSLSKKGLSIFNKGYITEWAKPMGWTSNIGSLNRWAVNQYITYQSWHSHNGSNNSNGDLFIDYHPPKSFAHIPTIKYNSALQQPIGTLVCQIYSGIFNKQISKNLLLINRKTTATTNYNILLIQALAGETELKIITDNAHRYALVNRGFAIGIKLLREVFDAIALNTPCIFLLEDIHAIGERRPMLISDYGSGMSDDHGTFKEDFFGGQRDEVHEKNQVIYQLTRHAITHYKKPFKGDYSLAIPTNLYVTDLFLKTPTQSTSNLNLIEKHYYTIKNKIKVKETKLLNDQTNKTTTEGCSRKEKLDLTSFLQIPHASSKIAPSSTSPFTVLLLKEEKKLKPNKIVEELPWNGLPGEQLLTKTRASYSVRAKVAMLAELSLSNLSAKLDMITDLLVIIDSVRGNKGFVVFATTNIPHVLDPALRRPGRLDETICMPNSTNDITSRVSYEIIKAVKPLTNNPLTGLFDRPLVRHGGWSLRNTNSKNINKISSNLTGLTVNLKDYSIILGQAHMRKNFENSNLNYALISHSSYLKRTEFGTATASTDGCSLREQVEINQRLLFSGWALPIATEGRYFVPPNSVLLLPVPKVAPGGSSSRADGFTKLRANAIKKQITNKNGYKTLKTTQFAYNHKKNNYKAIAYYEVGKVMLSYYLNTHIFGQKSEDKVLYGSEYRLLPTSSTKLVAQSASSKYTSQTMTFDQSPINNTQMSLKSINFLSLYGSKNKLMLQLMLLFGGKISQLLSSKKNKLNSKQIALLPPGSKIATEGSNLRSFESNLRWDEVPKVALLPEGAEQGTSSSSTEFGPFSMRHSPLENTKNFQIATSIMLAFIHKRYLYRKNLIVPKLLSFIDGNVLEEPPSPPFSSLLIPAKRFENFKRVFRDSLFGDKMGQRKSQISLSEKLQYHMQLRSIKLLKNSGISSNQSTFVTKDFPCDLLVQTTTNINWYYQNRILKRHGLYLTNQWWNGQLSEHNAETIFLSDIDWRSSFIKNKQINVVKSKNLFTGPANGIDKYGRNASLDIVLDFPDTDQYYNPRRRRWLLNKGFWSFWFNFDQLYSEEIMSTWILESIIQTYTYLHNNTEVLDFITSKYISLGYVTDVFNHGHYQPNNDISSRACIKEIILTNSFKRF